MRLINIFRFLNKKSLDKYLLSWYNNSYKTLEGKILSYNLTREFYLEKWEKKDYGYKLAEMFSNFIKKKLNYSDVVKIAGEFALDKDNLKLLKLHFRGTKSKKNNNTINIKQLEFCWRKLKMWKYGTYDIGNYTGILKQMNSVLSKKGAKVEIGNKESNLLFLTILNNNVRKFEKAIDVCNLLGMKYQKGEPYILIRIKNINNDFLKRPTILDGGFLILFYPYCDINNWGRTLTTTSLKKGNPEAVTDKIEQYIKFEKLLDSSDNELYFSTPILNNYLNRELQLFKSNDISAYQDLINSWKKSYKWWRKVI